MRNYLVSMGIRTLCFILAGVFAMATDWTVAIWVCVVAAAVLPYPAVVFANNVDRRASVMPTESPRRAIEGFSAPAIPGTVTEGGSHSRRENAADGSDRSDGSDRGEPNR